MAFAVPARVLMSDAPAILDAGSKAVRGGETEVDLGAVTDCDSSLVACLNEWRREARRAGRDGLSVTNAPESVRRIARLYGVESLALG
jgi:phospholipid transport system transporter-binding protein